jgi:hypothetical protein
MLPATAAHDESIDFSRASSRGAPGAWTNATNHASVMRSGGGIVTTMASTPLRSAYFEQPRIAQTLVGGDVLTDAGPQRQVRGRGRRTSADYDCL